MTMFPTNVPRVGNIYRAIYGIIIYLLRMSCQHSEPFHSMLPIFAPHKQQLHVSYPPKHSVYDHATHTFCPGNIKMSTAFHIPQELTLHPTYAFVCEPLTNECI